MSNIELSAETLAMLATRLKETMCEREPMTELTAMMHIGFTDGGTAVAAIPDTDVFDDEATIDVIIDMVIKEHQVGWVAFISDSFVATSATDRKLSERYADNDDGVKNALSIFRSYADGRQEMIMLPYHWSDAGQPVFDDDEALFLTDTDMDARVEGRIPTFISVLMRTANEEVSP